MRCGQCKAEFISNTNEYTNIDQLLQTFLCNATHVPIRNDLYSVSR